MRLSVSRGDPGYDTLQKVMNYGQKAIVIVDGMEVKHCIVADEEAGYVERRVTDEDGRFVVIDDEVLTERVNGTVRIRISD